MIAVYVGLFPQEDVSIPYRRVLVTGATGLLGRAVYREFQKNAWQALGCGYNRALPRFLRCNLLDEDAVRAVILDFQVGCLGSHVLDLWLDQLSPA